MDRTLEGAELHGEVPEAKFVIVEVIALVRQGEDATEVKQGFIDMLENDASVGGYVTVRRPTAIETVEFGETISDLTDEAL